MFHLKYYYTFVLFPLDLPKLLFCELETLVKKQDGKLHALK